MASEESKVFCDLLDFYYYKKKQNKSFLGLNEFLLKQQVRVRKRATKSRNPFGNIGREVHRADVNPNPYDVTDLELDPEEDPKEVPSPEEREQKENEKVKIRPEETSYEKFTDKLERMHMRDFETLNEVVTKTRNVLILSAVQKYASSKMGQCIRRRNISSFLAGMEANIILQKNELQKKVDSNLSEIKYNANHTLFPIEFGLFHKKTFEAKDVLELPMQERAKHCQNSFNKSKEEIDNCSKSIMEFVAAQPEKVGKSEITKVYNAMLGTMENIKECGKVLQAEIYLAQVKQDVISLSPTTSGLLSKIFDIEKDKAAEIPLVVLLDLKEYCRMRGLNEVLKIINRLISEHNNS